jgi:hypothetical protein
VTSQRDGRGYNIAMTSPAPRSVADIEGFVGLLKAACDDQQINATLERLLAMPDAQRQGVVHAWVSDLLIAEAPREFIEAVGCLMDDAVAEKAYAVIYQCQRNITNNDRAGHV